MEPVAETLLDLYADGTEDLDGAERFTGLGRTTLYQLMNGGELPFTKVGARRLIPRKALVALLAKGSTVAEA